MTKHADHPMPMLLDRDMIARMNAWWRAANYLSVGQIYLLANPLLRRCCGWSTSSRACWAIGAPHPD